MATARAATVNIPLTRLERAVMAALAHELRHTIPDLAAQFGVMSIPTLLVFQNGRLVNQAVGARPKSGVLALLDR